MPETVLVSAEAKSTPGGEYSKSVMFSDLEHTTDVELDSSASGAACVAI